MRQKATRFMEITETVSSGPRLRDLKKELSSDFKRHAEKLQLEADFLRETGWEFRGVAPRVFNPTFQRWLPETDFWSRPKDVGHLHHNVWATREQALAVLGYKRS